MKPLQSYPAMIHVHAANNAAHMELVRIIEEALSKHPSISVNSFQPMRGILTLNLQLEKKERAA